MQTSYLVPASRERVFEYIRDLHQLSEDLKPGIEVSFALVHDDFEPDSADSLSEPLSRSPSGALHPGSNARLPQVVANAEVALAVRRFGVTAHGLIRIERLQSPTEIVYCQKQGWFRVWRHTIELVEHSDGDQPTTLVNDRIDYRLPFAIFGTLADDLFFKRDLSRTLQERALRMSAYFDARPATVQNASTPSSEVREATLSKEMARPSGSAI